MTTESCPTFGCDFRSKFEALPDQLFWARTTIYSEVQEKTNTGSHPHTLSEGGIKEKSIKNKEKDALTRKLACQLWNCIFTKFKKLAPCETQHIQPRCFDRRAMMGKYCVSIPGITQSNDFFFEHICGDAMVKNCLLYTSPSPRDS